MSDLAKTGVQTARGSHSEGGDTTQKPLTDAAKRALAEAEERRQQARDQSASTEVGGRDGPDPVRYGDWEKDGIVSDF